MKSVIFILPSALLFGSLAMADNMSMVSVLSEVDEAGVAVSGCGGQTTGTSIASTSFFCNLNGLTIWGTPAAKQGSGHIG